MRVYVAYDADSVKSSLNGQLCSIIKNEINVEVRFTEEEKWRVSDFFKGNKVLATLPVQEKIDQYSLINFEMISAPSIPGDYIATHHKVSCTRLASFVDNQGEFFSITHPQEASLVQLTL